MTRPSSGNDSHPRAVRITGSLAGTVARCAVASTGLLALVSAIALSIGVADPSLQLASGAACVVAGSVTAVLTRSAALIPRHPPPLCPPETT